MTSNQGSTVPEQPTYNTGDAAQRAYEAELALYQQAQAHYEIQRAHYEAQQAQLAAHAESAYHAEREVHQAQAAAQAQYEAQAAAHAQFEAQQAQMPQESQQAQQVQAQHSQAAQQAQYEAQLAFVGQQQFAYSQPQPQSQPQHASMHRYAAAQQNVSAPEYAASAYYTGEPLPQVWTPQQLPPARNNGVLLGLSIAGILVAAGALALVLFYMVAVLGPVALVVATVMAMVPLVGILFAVRWIDRWEPEPRAALWFAFLWGAGVSVLLALLFDFGKEVVVYASGIQGDPAFNDFLAGTLQAPLVEEFGKGVGILIVFWVLRKSFNGPVDGVVYAATIAAGFAFTENIQYLGIAMLEGGVESSIQLWIIRCLMSPFAHVLFTICTGLAIGFAARKSSAFGAVGWFLLGWIAASLAHAFWNGSLFFLPSDSAFYIWYFVTQVPMFILTVLLVIYLRRAEATQTRQMLTDYQVGGWFTPQEVTMLATGAGRTSARRWAASQGPSQKEAMKKFILDATHLAQTRLHIIVGYQLPSSVQREHELLAAVAGHRAVLTA